MNEADLLQILARGEDSRHQFKRDETSADSVAAELAAFTNSGGGMLLLGAGDDGSLIGLDAASVRRLNQLISNAASQNVRPPIHPTTENVQTTQGVVIAVKVPANLLVHDVARRDQLHVIELLQVQRPLDQRLCFSLLFRIQRIGHQVT